MGVGVVAGKGRGGGESTAQSLSCVLCLQGLLSSLKLKLKTCAHGMNLRQFEAMAINLHANRAESFFAFPPQYGKKSLKA